MTGSGLTDFVVSQARDAARRVLADRDEVAAWVPGFSRDVFARLGEISVDIGCRALLVHSESTAARGFYLHLVPEFEPRPNDDGHLVVLVKDIRRP